VQGAIDENEVAGAARRRADYGWREIEKRLQATPAYWPAFQQAYPSLQRPADITIVHVANALDDFMNHQWRADESPFDQYLSGNASAMTNQQIAGMTLFYGQAGCSRCHSGALQTDHDFHALMLPPLGPGRTRAFDTLNRDPGRLNETDRLQDSYAFRTPSLRNVADTAPYGHNGAFKTLHGIVQHHLSPASSLDNYDRSQLIMAADSVLAATDFLLWTDIREMSRYRRYNDLDLPAMSTNELDQIIAFLHALTDSNSLQGVRPAPEHVPSGLPLD